MRILLDENFPLDFAKLLVADEVTILHVHSLGWSGIKMTKFDDELGENLSLNLLIVTLATRLS